MPESTVQSDSAIATEIVSDVENAASKQPIAHAEPKPHLVIEPVKGFRSLRLGEIWEFRDLLFTLGMRDVKLVYKQTLLGVAWVVMQPLIGAGIFTFVFGMLADMPAGELPYFAFSFAGMVGWTLFSATLNGASMVMVTNSHLVSKIYFPRLILPLSSAFQPIVNFGVSLLLMLAILLMYQINPGLSILLLPVSMALLLMLALGIGFWCSSIMVRYRDLRFVIPVAVQFLLYASPVGYSLAAINEKVPVQYQTAYMLNPLASLTEFFRWTLLGQGTISPLWLGYSVLIALITFMAGAFAFRRSERGFADVI
ncbi:ABC-2 type transporter [Rhodopirellula maiorica SM1]|uniref:Transport permease protein n=1 Tax=Rhodopirellula maiorica SM1 TaxID=1265738 RepID=M5R954_9BACT|nr:ABC transporter permease [Rhodopirellula maiorica]EMI15586.1 ABC-2 type transporter [Rhodopirellula maiorica SM1]